MTQPTLDPGRVGAVIVTHGSSQSYLAAVATLRDQGISSAHLVVVHNPVDARKDHRVEVTDTRVDIFTMHNRGFGSGLNVGISYLLQTLELKHFLLLSDDVEMASGMVAKLLDAASTHPRYGVLAPRVDFRSGDVFSLGGVEPRPGLAVHRRSLPDGPTQPQVVGAGWVTGAVWLLARSSVEAVGLFDERFFLYYEEPEYCFRLRQAGLHVGVVPSARAVIDGLGGQRVGSWAYCYSRNGMEYARMAHGWLGALYKLYALAIQGATIARDLVRPPPDSESRIEWLRLKGHVLGVIAFFCRRWGPPPTSLLNLPD